MASFRLETCVELNLELGMGFRVLDRRCFFISRSRTAGMQRLRPTHLRSNANAKEGRVRVMPYTYIANERDARLSDMSEGYPTCAYVEK